MLCSPKCHPKSISKQVCVDGIVDGIAVLSVTLFQGKQEFLNELNRAEELLPLIATLHWHFLSVFGSYSFLLAACCSSERVATSYTLLEEPHLAIEPPQT